MKTKLSRDGSKIKTLAEKCNLMIYCRSNISADKYAELLDIGDMKFAGIEIFDLDVLLIIIVIIPRIYNCIIFRNMTILSLKKFKSKE